MYTVRVSTRFKRDIKRCQKQCKDMNVFKATNDYLVGGEALPARYRDHLLTGNWRSHRECHLAPDWLLIYRINEEEKQIEYVRTGSHSELFS